MFDLNIQLLLACSKPAASPARREEVRELAGRCIDWYLLLDQAGWHCVSSSLYTVLLAEAPDLAPASVLSALRSRYQLNFRSNLFQTSKMVRLVQKFRERSIPAIAYKGPVLCSYYQDVGMRKFGDLDFLVAPADVPAAHEMLHQEGFHPHLYKPCLQESRTLPFARAFHYEMVYTDAGGSKVDLHWALMPGFWALPNHVKGVWSRLQTRNVAGGSVTTLCHEDTLLLLCAHGAKHMWRSLGWICDVAALLHSVPDLDWPAISGRAEKFRIRRALGLGLYLANQLLAAGLPPEVLRAIREDHEIEKLAATVKEGLFAAPPQAESVLASCSFLMRTRENAKDAIRCGLEQVFQPTMAEWQSIALPQILFPAYYFLRPMRLLTKPGLRGKVSSAA